MPYILQLFQDIGQKNINNQWATQCEFKGIIHPSNLTFFVHIFQQHLEITIEDFVQNVSALILSLRDSYDCYLTTASLSVPPQHPFIRSTSHMAGVILRTKGGAVPSVKFLGFAVLRKSCKQH